MTDRRLVRRLSLFFQNKICCSKRLNRLLQSAFLNLDQAMTSQANVVTSQLQVMMAQVNREVVPHMTQYACTIYSFMRHFTMMNTSMLFGSKEGEEPQNFVDKVYKILFTMVVSSNKKVEVAAY